VRGRVRREGGLVVGEGETGKRGRRGRKRKRRKGISRERGKRIKKGQGRVCVCVCRTEIEVKKVV
jgi:hypothetical protein